MLRFTLSCSVNICRMLVDDRERYLRLSYWMVVFDFGNCFGNIIQTLDEKRSFCIYCRIRSCTRMWPAARCIWYSCASVVWWVVCRWLGTDQVIICTAWYTHIAVIGTHTITPSRQRWRPTHSTTQTHSLLHAIFIFHSNFNMTMAMLQCVWHSTECHVSISCLSEHQHRSTFQSLTGFDLWCASLTPHLPNFNSHSTKRNLPSHHNSNYKNLNCKNPGTQQDYPITSLEFGDKCKYEQCTTTLSRLMVTTSSYRSFVFFSRWSQLLSVNSRRRCEALIAHSGTEHFTIQK